MMNQAIGLGGPAVNRSLHRFLSDGAGQAHRRHQPRHRASRDGNVPVCRSAAPKIRHDGPDLRRDAAAGGDAFTVQLPPNLAHPIDLEVLMPHASDLRSQLGVPPGALREQRGIGPTRGVSTIGRRSDRKNPSDRLDPVSVAMLINEHLHFFMGRSSSA